MNAPNNNEWIEVNRHALSAELAWLQQLLENAAHSDRQSVPAPAATATLNFLGEQLTLSHFERSLVLLCAGVELEPELAHLCASAQGDTRYEYPCFGLALAVLPDAHWSALSPQAPLRHWHILQLADSNRLTTARLALDERILHFLLGSARWTGGWPGWCVHSMRHRRCRRRINCRRNVSPSAGPPPEPRCR